MRFATLALSMLASLDAMPSPGFDDTYPTGSRGYYAPPVDRSRCGPLGEPHPRPKSPTKAREKARAARKARRRGRAAK